MGEVVGRPSRRRRRPSRGKYDVFLRPPSAEGKNRDAAALILAELELRVRGGKLVRR